MSSPILRRQIKAAYGRQIADEVLDTNALLRKKYEHVEEQFKGIDAIYEKWVKRERRNKIEIALWRIYGGLCMVAMVLALTGLIKVAVK